MSPTAKRPAPSGDADGQGREVRAKLRSMYNETREMGVALENPESTKLVERIMEANEIMDQMKPTARSASHNLGREVLLDAQHLRELGMRGKHQAQNLSQGARLSVVDMIFNLKKNFAKAGEAHPDDPQQRVRVDWTKLENVTTSIYRRCVTSEFLYGPLDVKQRTKRAAYTREKITSQVAKVGEGAAGADDRNRVEKARIEYIIRKAREEKHENMNFFEFIIDPTSYTKTIENLYFFSFALKDGVVRLHMDKGIPRIYALKTGNDHKTTDATMHQAIVSLSKTHYDEFIQALHITQPVLRFDEEVLSKNQ